MISSFLKKEEIRLAVLAARRYIIEENFDRVTKEVYEIMLKHIN